MPVLIRRLTVSSPREIDEFAEWVVDAFAADPISLPSVGSDLSLLPGVYRGFAAATFVGGEVYAASANDDQPDAVDAIAMWYPPGTDFLETDEQYTAWKDVFGQHLNPDAQAFWQTQYQATLKQAEARSMQPHEELGKMWHLQLIAVRPSCQGRGLCKALISHKRNMLAAAGKSTAMRLETFTDKNVRIYQRLGFKEDARSDECVTPHGRFSIICMSAT